MTEICVGIVPDENLVVMSVDGESVALPMFGAIKIGLLLVKAGLSAGSNVVSADSLVLR